MKPPIPILMLAAALLLAVAPAWAASWRLDRERFHVGAHGRLACAECHESAAARRPHPDPQAVTRTKEPSKALDACGACHRQAAAEAEAGRHGGHADFAERPLAACTACHDPHAGLSSAAPAEAADAGLPAEVKCRLCHALERRLPPPAPGEEGCLACHERPAPEDPAALAKTQALCFHCHAPGGAPGAFPRVDPAAYAATPHRAVACIVCHPASDRYGHAGQPRGDCRSCHSPHPAAVAHDVHLGVDCGACHVPGAVPFRERGGGRVGWVRPTEPAFGPSAVHHMTRPDRGESCRRCHAPNNGLGAPAAVLPPKSVICMPCHAATLSAGDGVTIAALAGFVLGMAAVGGAWFSGHQPRPAYRRSDRGGVVRGMLAGFLLDGLLQRRLFRHSRGRWALHALLVFPFAFRALWGLAALAGSRLMPQTAWVWAMLDPNHPLTALLLDASGLAILLGGVAMVVRRAAAPRLPGLPPADWPGHALLAAVMATGFVLEGARIALSGFPSGSAFAFVGDGLGRAFYGAAGLDGLYVVLWYAHAVLTAAFFLYLPFSRMLHMVLVPIWLALKPITDHEPPNA